MLQNISSIPKEGGNLCQYLNSIRTRILVALLTLLFVSGQSVEDSAAQEIGVSQSALKQKNFKVGHTILRLDVPGSFGETRPVAVHLWYPGDKHAYNNAAPTTYTSALAGVPLIEAQWDPLSWEIQAESARENIPIYDKGPPFSVIIFSHGSTNDPIDYAYTLENLASEGFVVAAPAHVNNTQDDVRIDFINEQAGFQLLDCLRWKSPAVLKG